MTSPATAPPGQAPFASDPARAAALAALRRTLAVHAAAWVVASQRAKGWAHLPAAAAEEWASGPLPVARFLAALARGGGLRPAHTTSVDGCAVHAAPTLGSGDRLLLLGHRAELHTLPGRSAVAAPAGGTCLVLGAGNVTATPVLDVLDQVFVHGRRVVLKPSPLHEALLPVWREAMAPLLAAGVLTFAAGDAGTGAALARDPAVTAVHLTGSAATWAMLRNDPLLRGKALTAEVGCCTPAIVLPGPWPPAALQALAGLLAGAVAMNGGATCLAPRVLLCAQHWPQRDDLLTRLTSALAAAPPRVPFHPGVRPAWEAATATPAPGAALPARLCADERGEAARTACGAELFAPVLREFALPGDDLAAFTTAAVEFVRTHCFGRLSAYVFAPRAVHQREAATVAALVAALPHGTIAVDDWTGLGYGLGTTPWGVPPDSPIDCGSGFARNLTGHTVRRVVVRGTLPARLVPPWSADHRRGAATLRALTLHTLAPSLPHLLRTALHALRP